MIRIKVILYSLLKKESRNKKNNKNIVWLEDNDSSLNMI